MENNFDNRDFERTVRQNAEQFRMFPSDRVWKGVEDALYRRRRWYGIGLALLLVTTATVTMVMLTPSDKSEFVRLGRNASFTMGVPLSSIASSPSILVQAPLIKDLSRAKNFPAAIGQNYFSNPDLSENSNKELPGIETDELVNHYRNESEPVTDLVIENRPSPITKPASISKPDHIFKNLSFLSKSPVIDQKEYVKADISVNSDATDLFMAASTNKKHTENNELKKENKLLLPPFTIESVINSYKHTRGQKKLNWLLYLTPTISYRTLSENTEFISAARYNSIVNGTGNNTNPVFYSTDVNSVVQHRPDLGMQFGLRAGLPLSQWFSITSGFQLSISKYDIRASETNAEIATIALTTRNTLNTVTNFRNEKGAKENWLRNFYFSASIPVGMELKLSDGSKNYFGIATTLQPTFVLDNRAYLITTDYKNYAEVPSLTRKFNVNTSFEIFSAHTTGKVQWRVGPQVHYQLMSSFNKNYPIKEHLFDFGLKLGIQLK